MSEHVALPLSERIDLAQLAHGRDGHSAFSPSYSPTWLFCAGSLIPSLLAPDDAGEDAAYGTVAHYVTEQWLTTGRRPVELLGEARWVESGDWGFSIVIDDVMLDYAEECVDWVEFLPGEHFVEVRVDFSRITPIPKQGGTADHVAVMPGKLVVTDWKFGKGVLVYAIENTQALLYALGVFYRYDHLYHFEEIEIRIGQPRLDHWDTWTITRAQLLEFEQWAKPRAHAAWRLNAPRTPGIKQCYWCKVRNDCAAKAKMMADLIDGAFADLTDVEVTLEDVQEFRDHLDLTIIPNTPDLMSLTTEEMERMLQWRRPVEHFFKSLAEEVERRAHRRERLHYHKLVQSSGRRVFRYPKQAAEKLVSLGVPRSKAFRTEYPSPNQAEDLLVAAGHRRQALPNLLDGLIYQPPGKPTLAPITDKRDALVDPSGDAFGDLIETRETLDSEEL